MSIATFYFQDPRAPKPNRPAHLGVNVLLQWQDKLLLERRRVCPTLRAIPVGKAAAAEKFRRWPLAI